jgi:hypothetical protein
MYVDEVPCVVVSVDPPYDKNERIPIAVPTVDGKLGRRVVIFLPQCISRYPICLVNLKQCLKIASCGLDRSSVRVQYAFLLGI